MFEAAQKWLISNIETIPLAILVFYVVYKEQISRLDKRIDVLESMLKRRGIDFDRDY
jgi:hypothetical protein